MRTLIKPFRMLGELVVLTVCYAACLLRWGVTYCLLLLLGFAMSQAFWALYRGNSVPTVWTSLNLTLPRKGCHF